MQISGHIYNEGSKDISIIEYFRDELHNIACG